MRLARIACDGPLAEELFSARASRLRSQLLLWNLSTTNATEYFVAISEVSGVPCSPPRAHGGLPAKMRQGRPTFKKIPT